MQRLLYAVRHALPVLFLAYAAAVNLDIFTEPGALGPVKGGIVNGEAADSLNGLYSAALPHREPAVSLVGAARYLALGEGRKGVTVGENDWLFTDEEMQAAGTGALDRAVETVEQVEARLAEIGTELVVVPVPAKIDIYRDRGPRAAGAAMERQYRRFRKRLEAAGIASVDTRPALQDAKARTPVFLTSDTHWTPAGARRVARKVAESGLVEKGSTEFVKRPARPEEFVGDLVSFVTSKEIAPSLGIAPERVTPYVAEKENAASGGIFASESGPIEALLVGTSYSANPNWSFVPALKLALERDILNLAEEGRGPVAPMRDVLADPKLAETPPEVVIWEYPVRYIGGPASKTARKETAHG